MSRKRQGLNRADDLYFTFDVELYTPLRGDRRFLKEQGSTWERVLERLEDAGIRVTLFVTGEFCQTYPALFQAMVDADHEIASHTMTHRPYFSIGDRQFEQEVMHSKAFLEERSQTFVQGFRAPLGQIPAHLAGLLHKHHYAYDSSVAATHIPGRFQALGTPQRIYHPALDNVRHEDRHSAFWEIPIAVTPGVPIPYGGFFLSWIAPFAWCWPYSRRRPHVMFLHPYDFIPLRSFAACYPWDKWKRTATNWRLLAYYCRHRQGADTRLQNLITTRAGQSA